jgi:hypothetical protein
LVDVVARRGTTLCSLRDPTTCSALWQLRIIPSILVNPGPRSRRVCLSLSMCCCWLQIYLGLSVSYICTQQSQGVRLTD